MRPNRSTLVRLLIGVTILALVIWYSKPVDLWSIITGAAVGWLVLAIAVHIVATSVTALRMAYLAGRLDLFVPMFKANLGGMLLADVTPGRAGYFVTPVIVNRECPEMKTGHILNVMFFGQVFDFLLRAVLLVTAMFTIFYALGVSQNLYLYAVLSLGLVVVLVIGFAVLAFGKIPRFVVPLVERVQFLSKLYAEYSKYIGSTGYTAKKSVVAFLITILGWLITALRWIIVGQALGLDLPIVWYLFLFPALTAVSFIPVSLAGLGIVEGGFALVFSVLGRPIEDGLAFALVDRTIALIGDMFGLPFATKLGLKAKPVTSPSETGDVRS